MKVPRRISTDRSAAWFTILASVVAVICWSIFFAGCTSSSTSEHLYLMEVNLKGFPEIRGSSIGQGFSQLLPRALPIGVSPKEIPTEIGSATSGIASTVENTPQEVAGAAENIASEIKLHLPDYYRVGLWGYCSGDDDQKAVCSHPLAKGTGTVFVCIRLRQSQGKATYHAIMIHAKPYGLQMLDAASHVIWCACNY
ncbi:hypothetical protein N7478_010252 [Penicillium angulare]|uniref:uncharacterized protein n=1 Tax=Penicillium angulare TaxID=116970 RepID=UPI0025420AC3|nr:uncharacterized protein N7478_010252 [Penicillium angulare]KAJ5267444.1 hypothetical protein N7478_010252 [Penicillium angulare]